MLISYRHKFIFIHTYKVAGTSVTNALKPYAFHNPFERLLYIFQRRYGLSFNGLLPSRYRAFAPHTKAAELRSQLPPDVYDKFFKFAFVRNPWDWQVSLYVYMKEKSSHKQHDLIAKMSFDEYVKWRLTQDRNLQKDFVVDREGEKIVDFIGRYEKLSEDFQYICNILGFNASLPHVNKSTHKDYREYYNEETKSLIEEGYKEDIDFFGFSFDDGIGRRL
jgi:hypothetical protein